jgi:hypothetical protein
MTGILSQARSLFFHKISLSSILFFFVVTFLFPFLASGQTEINSSFQPNQVQRQIESQLEGVQIGDHSMHLGIWILHIYNFQYITGTYTLDMYVYFFWTDPNITTANWYLTNGYPINSAAKILVESNVTGDIKYELYRVTATLNTPPDAKDYPFDQISLKISLELINPGYSVDLAWLENQTGLDTAFNNPNWRTTNIELSTSKHSYPLGVEAPYAEMAITQAKLKPSSALASLLPLIVFSVVSATSFLFSLTDLGSVGLRMGLNTSMLITTILTSLSIGSAIPPSSSVSIFALILMSVLVFLSLNLVVTIFGFAHFVKYKNANFTKKVNRWGFLISIITPILLYIILFTLSA